MESIFFPVITLSFTTPLPKLHMAWKDALLFYLFPVTDWTLAYLKCLPSGTGEEKRTCWRFYKDPGWQARHRKNSTWLLRFKLQQSRGRPSRGKKVRGSIKTKPAPRSEWQIAVSASSHITGTNAATRTSHGLVTATSVPMSDGREVFACRDCYPFCFSRVTSTALMVPAWAWNSSFDTKTSIVKWHTIKEGNL